MFWIVVSIGIKILKLFEAIYTLYHQRITSKSRMWKNLKVRRDSNLEKRCKQQESSQSHVLSTQQKRNIPASTLTVFIREGDWMRSLWLVQVEGFSCTIKRLKSHRYGHPAVAVYWCQAWRASRRNCSRNKPGTVLGRSGHALLLK